MGEGTARAMQRTLPSWTLAGLLARLRLPNSVPPMGRRSIFIFEIFWTAALVLAVVGPIAGLYER